jgi:hypothetical protein
VFIALVLYQVEYFLVIRTTESLNISDGGGEESPGDAALVNAAEKGNNSLKKKAANTMGNAEGLNTGMTKA